MSKPGPKPLRCAIYTRVSTDHGLEQDFNSLHAQREAAEAYVTSQAQEGWRVVRERFADGGFSGGSLDRPALQRLLTAMDGSSLDQIAVREGCTTRHVAKTIPLAFLAPDLVQALIEARLPRGFSTKRIGAPELEWARQWERLGVRR